MPDHIYTKNSQQAGKEVGVKEGKSTMFSSPTAVFPTCVRSELLERRNLNWVKV